MNKFEQEFLAPHDYQDKNIAGVDEVGRGSLAGPIVVGAVILPNNYYNSRILDSKRLTKKRREQLAVEIKSVALAYSLVEVSSEEVERLNPKRASILGMELAIDRLNLKPDYILTDAERLSDRYPHFAIIQGDNKSQSIAAAAIIAKVHRDELMTKYDAFYSWYDWKNNKGYGTLKHRNALIRYGLTPLHRKTYQPVKKIIKNLREESNL